MGNIRFQESFYGVSKFPYEIATELRRRRGALPLALQENI